MDHGPRTPDYVAAIALAVSVGMALRVCGHLVTSSDPGPMPATLLPAFFVIFDAIVPGLVGAARLMLDGPDPLEGAAAARAGALAGAAAGFAVASSFGLLLRWLSDSPAPLVQYALLGSWVLAALSNAVAAAFAAPFLRRRHAPPRPSGLTVVKLA